MLSQNRQSKKADLRAELDYEVNVKAEKEVGEIIALLKSNQTLLQKQEPKTGTPIDIQQV